MPPSPTDQKKMASDPVNRVVLKALTSVAPMFESGERRRPMESYLTSMMDAVLAPTPRPLAELVQSMQKARVEAPQIVESYVPLVARRLGEGWVRDRLDFGAVTIGAARLQSLVRRFDQEGLLHHEVPAFGAQSILLGVPDGEQHILGATVLAQYLRARGVSVHLDLELTVGRLSQELARQRFTGVFLSISGEQYLEPLGHLVACTRYESRSTPVIVGGALLDQREDIAARTGADLATGDVDTALRYCAMAVADEAALPQVNLPKVGE